MRKILESYTAPELRKEIAKTSITGFKAMKKASNKAGKAGIRKQRRSSKG